MKIITMLLLILCSSNLISQILYNGVVLDEETNNPLPFVNIRIEGSNKGFTTDVNGKYSYSASENLLNVIVRYVGYKDTSVVLKSDDFETIYIRSTSQELDEIIVNSDYNPALPIIRKVIKNRSSNNPEKNLNFTYRTYNKFIVRAEYDSLYVKKNDSTLVEMKKFFDKQDLMLIETVVENFHEAPNRNKENVIATRTSGLSSVKLPMLVSELQSFSFYNTYFTISSIEYINPITSEGFQKYAFTLENQYVEEKDTVFVISFKHKKGRAFSSLKGVLYISSYKYAIKNVIAVPEGDEEMGKLQINQKYQLLDTVWFPEQLNSTLSFPFGAVEGLDFVGTSTAYLDSINLNPKAEVLKFDNISVDIVHESEEMNNVILKESRVVPLSKRDSVTYHVIDSLGKAEKLDRKLEAMESLIAGRVALGKFDLDLNSLFDFNNHEGVRLGTGLYTNKRLSKRFLMGGYFGYGFKDKVWKYGGEANLIIHKRKDVGVNILYRNDLHLAGEISLGESKKLTDVNQMYRFFASRFDSEESWRGIFHFRLRNSKIKVYSNYQRLKSLYNYSYLQYPVENIQINSNSFLNVIVGGNIEFSPFSKTMFNGYKIVDIPSSYPVFHLKYESTIPSLSDNTYTRIIGKISDSFSIPFIGTSHFSLVVGSINDDAPYPLLFNQKGINERYSLSVFESFETMYTNEFVASKFINAFFEQKIATLFKMDVVQPDLLLYSAIGWGNKLNESIHTINNFRTMEKGYFESGIKLNNILKSTFSGYGAGLFYRYGPNSSSKKTDNLVVKFTLSTSF